MTVIDNLPAHVLLVHAVVVLLPLAALMAVLSAVWPAARRKLGILTPVVALVALAFVPLTTHAGEWLEEHLPESDLISKHTALGDGVLPWAVGLFVVAALVWAQDVPWVRERTNAKAVGSVLSRAVVALVVVAVASGAVLQTYRTGASGAQASWSDTKLSSQTDAGTGEDAKG